MDFMIKFENNVKGTIKKYNLLSKKDKVLVACSGGKDSTVALYLLNKFGYNVSGLIVDLEIGKYSQTNLDNIRKFCKDYDLKLHEASFREEFGFSKCRLERELKKKNVKLNSCSICGVLRRYMLNKKARDLKFDKIVTGHNLDDEAQAILMNFFRNTMQLQSRLGPVSGSIIDKKFIPRIKPLYFCPEEDIKKYSKKLGFQVLYDRCPCIIDSYRNKVRDILNEMPTKVKENIVINFLKMLPLLKKKYSKGIILSCSYCGEPSSDKICTTCKIMANLKN
jgi:uncharacterized protein (TIGR00269 family)